MNIELFKNNLKRIPTILLIIFSIITLGIYQCFWVHSRKKSLNQITVTKINDALVIIYIITFSLTIVLGLYAEILIMSENLFQIMQGVQYRNYSTVCSSVSLILVIVIAFSMKNILKEFSANNEMNISYNGFFTVILNTVYINYKINENIDNIVKNNVVDKKETITTETETTSDKTIESPDERLKKLADVKDKGLINEEEFNRKKEEILKDI